MHIYSSRRSTLFESIWRFCSTACWLFCPPGPSLRFERRSRPILRLAICTKARFAVVVLLIGVALFLMPKAAYAQESHCGPITSNETWSNQVVHVISCDVDVTQSATLTIQGGAVIKFQPQAQINVLGQLLAVGTAGSPIYFTSYKDDAVGGDTDSAAETPAIGDWGNIQFKSGSGGLISRAVIRYSGLDNIFGVINDAPILVTNSSPELSYITFEKNYYNAVEIDSGGDWITSGNSDRWDSNTVVYVIDKSDIVIPATQSLSLTAGIKIKIGENRNFHVHGMLNIEGESGNPVILTSLQDDTLCGVGANGEAICDSNNDGDATSPAVGDWGNIQFYPESNDNSTISRTIIQYSGRASGLTVRDGPITLDNASPTLANITFAENYLNGAVIRSGIEWQTDSWDSSTVVYLLNRLDLSIPAFSTLSISPGALIKLGDDVSFNVAGTLNAVGTSQAPVTFSSLADDGLCGIGAADEAICDTNGDGTASSPARGDWGQIQFRPGSDASQVARAIIRYSGSDNGTNIDDGPIWLENASPTLDHITFEQNYLNAVEISGATNWSSTTWRNSTVVHVVEDADIVVPLNQTLTIEPGFKLKLADDRSIQIQGKINAVGTADAPIRFTSVHDDTVCGIGASDETLCDSYGDGDGDGAGPSPKAGDWGHIRFDPASDDSSVISRAEIRYSGANLGLDINDGAIYLDNAAPTFSYISFLDNYINGVELRGQTTWGTASWSNPTVLYVLEEGDITIPLSNTLTIGADMTLKLGNHASLKVAGELIAVGSSAEPITFTSLYDDSVCGVGFDGQPTGCETRLNSALTEPHPGDWGKIEFMAGSRDESTLSRAVLLYSGTNNDRNDNAAILLDNVAPSLSYISFGQNEVNGVSLSAGTETQWQTNQWANNTVVYVISESNVTIPLAQELTIAQGAKIKFDAHKSLIVNGKLTVAGTFEKPVYFTSVKDDTICGIGAFDEPICDTNGDATLEENAIPQVGNWGQIRFTSSSSPASTVERAIIRYSGNDKGIDLNDSAILLEGASPAILYSVLTQNYRGIEVQSGGAPALTCNDLYGNQDFGLYNANPAELIIARQHWWGDPSGPTHINNASGTGEKVSDGIEFSPWEIESCMAQENPDRQAPTIESDLELLLDTQSSTASVGAVLPLTATVSNLGTSAATAMEVRFTLPGQVTFASATYPGGSCVESGGTVTCAIGNLATGRSVEILLIVSVTPELSGNLTFTGEVGSSEIDPNGANNSVVLVIGPSNEAEGLIKLYLPMVR